ncbi:MAG: branched-chain amino acid ABC transporter permease [Anaerolineae bacterium]|nr:branched-chain amino acid ABC transporter permease [Anaerolineae bacterium]
MTTLRTSFAPTQNPSTTLGNRIGLGGIIVAVIAILIALQASGSSVWQGIFINLGMFIILVASLNLANGFTGVFSLGHIGFMALGAYISAILTLPVETKASYLPNLPEWLAGVHFDAMLGPFPLGFLLATIVAGLLVAVVALLVGAVLMRLSGNFVSVATLGFLIIVRVVLINADAFTRGSRTFSNVTAYTDLWWVYAWVAVVLYCLWRIKFSAYGRAMFAQREDTAAAQSVGIVIMRPRLLAYVISAFFTAVAGALWGHFITSFSPATFYFDLTFRVITMLVVGGMGSVTGSVLGPITIITISEILRRFEDANQLYGISGFLLALLFIIIIITRPGGLMDDREISFGWLGRLLGVRSAQTPTKRD